MQDQVRFGVIADVHKDVMHDADHRLQVFVDAMKDAQPDFVIQLGDFCQPIPENRGFMDIWEQLAGARHHVLGNHDMDGDGKHRPDGAYAFAREETAEYWGMPAAHYSFDVAGVHFIVLDGNDQGPEQTPYFRYMAEEQLEWLRQDLAATRLPTVAFSHQSLERRGGVANGEAVRAVMEQANRGADGRKVIACFSGHHHLDYCRRLNGIIYPQINSASYSWLGGEYLHVRYSDEIDRDYPYIKYTVPYEDPLYALVTIDLRFGFLRIEGVRSRFVGPSPWELGASREELDDRILVPSISDWKIPV